MVLGQCVPYTFAEEFQRIRECLAELGCTQSAGGTAYNFCTPERVLIHGDFQEILILDVPDNKKCELGQVYVSLLGFSCEIVVEYSADLLYWEMIKSYICNVQQPNFVDAFYAPITKLPRENETSYSRIRVRGRMNGGAGDNLNGLIFVNLSGYLYPYP